MVVYELVKARRRDLLSAGSSTQERSFPWAATNAILIVNDAAMPDSLAAAFAGLGSERLEADPGYCPGRLSP